MHLSSLHICFYCLCNSMCLSNFHKPNWCKYYMFRYNQD